MKEIEKLQNQQTDLHSQVYGLQVVTRTDYEGANELTKACIALEKEVKAYFDEPKKSAMNTHKKLVAMEREQLEPLAKMKTYLKAGMTGYIMLEEAYHDGIRDYLTARNTADEMLSIFDNDELKALREKADQQSKLGKDEVSPQLFREDAMEVLRRVRELAPVEVEEVAEVKTGLRKLSLTHNIEVTDLRQLVEMVANGKAPLEWLVADVSAITKSAKYFDDESKFNQLYAGVNLQIERGVR